jgi:hypothetical protein
MNSDVCGDVYITDLLIWSFTITANGVFVTVLEIGLI